MDEEITIRKEKYNTHLITVFLLGCFVSSAIHAVVTVYNERQAEKPKTLTDIEIFEQLPAQVILYAADPGNWGTTILMDGNGKLCEFTCGDFGSSISHSYQPGDTLKSKP